MSEKFSMLERRKKSMQGQVVIVVILIMLVISLIMLAVASRSVTDLTISRTSDDSARAFSAAEAGIESAVAEITKRTSDNTLGSVGLPTATNEQLPSSGATYSYTAEEVSGAKAYLSPTQLTADIQSFQVYLANKSDLSPVYTAGSICLLWGNEQAADNPTIEASAIYKNGTTWSVVRKQYNGDDGTCASRKTVLKADNNLGVDRKFKFAHLFDYGGSNAILLRLRLINSPATSHYVGVYPQSGSLPVQGYKISSTGKSGTSTRKVEVFQAYPALAGIFDFALYNGSGNQILKEGTSVSTPAPTATPPPSGGGGGGGPAPTTPPTCVNYYPDLDGDGFGGAGSGNPVLVCPGDPIPSGYGQVQSGGTDCDDSDSRVHPGQNSFFTTPSKGGTWNYDCDSQITHQYAVLNKCPGGTFTADQYNLGFDQTTGQVTCQSGGSTLACNQDDSLPQAECGQLGGSYGSYSDSNCTQHIYSDVVTQGCK